MINLEKAEGLILNSAVTGRVVEKHIFLSLGSVLAQDIKSDMDMPPYEKSAMDGYAVRFSDLEKGTHLKIIEKISAGSIPKKKIEDGECSYITTGAMLPKGSDTVIRIEDTYLAPDNRVKVIAKHKKGENICRRAEDIRKGQVVLKKGRFLLAQDIGILASAGREFVSVFDKPGISLVTTGDELVDISKKPKAGEIRDSNTYSIGSQVMGMGIMPHIFGIVGDDKAALKKVFSASLKYSDILLISGGVSKGEYDFNKEVLKSLGVKFIFEKLSIRPGMPTSFGVYKGGGKKVLVFGLAGNPVSTFVIFEILVKPAIKKMMGILDCLPKYKQAKLADNLYKKRGRTHFLPGHLYSKENKYYVLPLRFHGSADLFSLTKADALISVPKQASMLKKGSWVKVLEIGGEL